ncbi:sulfotransferase family protein [Actinophytocola oryzae]|uniref:Sulfotransferase family protein n=1 Tax=Actinophytocola oryzae TaxID=502181 RepID=A0A4R7VXS9_9PSEU|nr:sulfotransferase [Actinophytocola oryzae]TDV54966.1 sulfotransferase family protein [Actinophytocola oryzae]
MTTALLDVDGLLASAREKTGLTDFGDEWFVEPLRVLVTALRSEARLSELGLALTRRRLTALLADRLRLRQAQSEHPAILDEEVVVAAEICGLPRTGSTLMHRLLAASPSVTSTLSWETSYPLPFPGEGPDAAERKQRAKDRAELFLRMTPEFGDIHTIEWDGPEEDVILLDRTFVSMSFDSFYQVPTYGLWLRAADQTQAYRELREWLQVLQWQDPSRRGKPWVLKSPHHLTAVDTVLDTFPTCRIVMTHRSPAEAVPSYASMVTSICHQYSDDVDPVAIGRYWRDRFAATLREFTSVRARRPDRFVDVRFRDVVSDPLAEAVRVSGLVGVPADREALSAYLARNRAQRHGSHTYTAADFGLSEADLKRDFAFYEEVVP